MDKLIIANWKMNGSFNKIVEDFSKYINHPKTNNSNIVYALPYVFLDKINHILTQNGARFKIASQDISQFDKFGAHTGEICGIMLKELNVSYSIIGHSERRAIGDCDRTLIKKIDSSIANGITPIFCIGEPYEIRQNKKYIDFLTKQLEVLRFLNYKIADIIVAYEPIWAIGTGLTPQISEIIEIMDLINSIIGVYVSHKVTVLYGGSVSEKNILELLNNPKIGGALVGGASLKVEDFITICSA